MAKFFTLNTGAKIPSIGLGTWQAEPGVVGNSVIAAVKAGYMHIDCARAYKNEEEIHWPFRVKKGTGFNPEDFIKPDIPSTWTAMEKLYDSGKARAIGVSNFSSKKLADLLAVARVSPAVDQVECHPSWQQTKLRSFCQSKGVHLSGYSPLGSPGTTWMKGNVLANPIVTLVAEKLGKTPAQVALRWGIQKGHSVLPKSVTEARIKENLSICDWSIPEDLFAKFSEIGQGRLVRGEFLVHEKSVYKSVEELWDGEI